MARAARSLKTTPLSATAAAAVPPHQVGQLPQPLLPPPLDPRKTTVSMRDSLQKLQQSLLCPLCQNLLTMPSTLPCSHTFCYPCIESYSCNSWHCPVPGCNLPFTVRGSRKGSFIKCNPSIQSVLTSLEAIHRALHQAPNEWWKLTLPQNVVVATSAAAASTKYAATATVNDEHKEHVDDEDENDDNMKDKPPNAASKLVVNLQQQQQQDEEDANDEQRKPRAKRKAAATTNNNDHPPSNHHVVEMGLKFSLDSCSPPDSPMTVKLRNDENHDEEENAPSSYRHRTKRLPSMPLPNTSPDCSPIARRSSMES